MAARIAAGQQGNVTRAQLLSAGVSSSTIGRWSEKGLLHREFLGVYRFGHRAPSLLARYAAAVLRCGDGAALAGMAAARLLELLRSRHVPPPEVVGTVHRAPRAILLHRARSLPSHEVIVVRGIRCTTPARTLVDIAAVLPLEELARAHHEADVRYRVDPDEILKVLASRSNVRNAANLRSVVLGDTPALLSRLEKGFVALVDVRGDPKPVVNRPAGAHWVDCRWPEHSLTVELNSFRFHRSRKAWEGDMRRERAARGRGDRFRRFTWFDVFEDSGYLHATLDELLPRSRST